MQAREVTARRSACPVHAMAAIRPSAAANASQWAAGIDQSPDSPPEDRQRETNIRTVRIGFRSNGQQHPVSAERNSTHGASLQQQPDHPRPLRRRDRSTPPAGFVPARRPRALPDKRRSQPPQPGTPESRRHRRDRKVNRANDDEGPSTPVPNQSIRLAAAYWPTWKVKLPSVVCVSTERTRHVT